MVQQLSSLRAEAAMDGGDKFVATAQAMASALDKMKASAEASAAGVEQNDVRVINATNGFDRMRLRVDAVARAQADLDKASRSAASAIDTGKTTQDQANAVLSVYQQRLVAAKQAAGEHTGAVKLQTWQIGNLWQQIQDVAVQLGSGQNPFTIMLQQGPQVTTAMGGLSNSLALVRSWLDPVYIGAALFAGGLALVVSHSMDLRGEAAKAAVAIDAMGKSGEISTAQFHAMVLELRAAGLSASDARDTITSALRDISRASESQLARATEDAANFGAAYGVPVDQAMKKLAALGSGGYDAIKKLDDAYNFLTPDQLQSIRTMALAGDQAGAYEAAMAALEARIKGANDNSLSPFSAGVRSLSKAWSEFLDNVSGSGLVVDMINSWAWALRGFRDELNATQQAEADEQRIAQLRAAVANTSGVQRQGAQAALDAALLTQARAQLGTGGAAHGPVGTGQTSAAASANAKEIDAATEAYRQQVEVLQANAAERSIVQARLTAETAALLAGKDALTAHTLGEIAAAGATAKLAAAANDNLRAIAQSTADTRALGAAYGQGTEAVIRAQAATQAHSQALANAAVDVTRLTQALVDQKHAELDAAAAQELAAEKLKTQSAQARAEAARLTDPQAQHDSDLAIARAERLNELQVKYGDNVVRINELMTEFDRQQAYDDQTRYWTDVGNLAKQYSDDVKGYIVDGLTGATNNGKSLWSNMWDAALAGGKRFLINFAATLLQQKFVMPILMNFIGGNSGLFGITSALGGSGGVSGIAAQTPEGAGLLNSFSSLFSGSAGSLLSSAGSWISGLFGGGTGATAATSVAHTGLAMGAGSGASGLSGLMGSIPVWGWIATAASMLKGMVAGSSPTSAGGVLNTLLLPSIEEWQANPGRSLYNVTNPIGTVLRDYGVSDGIAGLFGIDPVGSALTSFGLPSFLTPGGLIGSLFGNNKPSDMAAQTNVNLATQAMTTNEGDPSERSQTNIDATKSLASTFADYEKQILALTGGTAGQASAWVKVGSRDGIVVGLGQEGGGVNSSVQQVKKGFSNSEEGAQQALDWMVDQLSKQLTGVMDADYKRILQMGGTADQVLKNLQAAQQIKGEGVYDLVTQTTASLNDLVTQFGSLKQYAVDLSLATDNLVSSEKTQLQALEASTRSTYTQKVQDYIGQFLTPLQNLQTAITGDTTSLGDKFLQAQQSFRNIASYAAQGSETALSMLSDAGSLYLQYWNMLKTQSQQLHAWLTGLAASDLSTSTPLEKLNASKSAYDALLAQVQGGDQSKYGDLTNAATDYLTLLQKYDASGALYQQGYQDVTTAITGLANSLDAMSASATNQDVASEISATIGPLISELSDAQAQLLTGIQPTLDNLNQNFRDSIDVLRDEGNQTRTVLTQIEQAIAGAATLPASTASTTTTPETTNGSTQALSYTDWLAQLQTGNGPGSGGHSRGGGSSSNWKAYQDYLAGLAGHADGGLITGPGTGTSDSVLWRGSAGEYVNTAATVSRLGVGFFDALNAGGFPLARNDNSDIVAALGRSSAQIVQTLQAILVEQAEMRSESRNLTSRVDRLDATIRNASEKIAAYGRK